MVEYDDLDFNLNKKAELVAKAEELANSTVAVNAAEKIRDLTRAWKRLGKIDDYESVQEEELRDKFQAALDSIKARSNAATATVAEAKTAIIEKAKEVANMQSMKQAQAKMDELMNEWKAAGRSNAETDDALWEQFKEVRNTFFAKKKEFYNSLTEKFAASKASKEEIIAKAEALASSTNQSWKKATDEMNALMDQWKAAGNAGKNVDDELWAKFSAARKSFNSQKNAYYAQLKAGFAEKAAKKAELIAEAKKCVAQVDFSEEMIAKVKGLREQWKAVGSCGKDKEEELWNQFNETINNFFKNMRDYK